MGSSEYSKGKGSRRSRSRGGGAGKRKAHPWESRAVHAEEDPALLGEETAQLRYSGVWGKSAPERIYVLDQEFARAGIPYAAVLEPGCWRPAFTIFVPAAVRDTALDIIKRLEAVNRKTAEPQCIHEEPQSAHHESMQTILPEDVPDHLKDHPWEFAIYSEYDGPIWYRSNLIYRALVFRNKTHTSYGIKEWHDPGAPSILNKMARRIVVDDEFRQSLVTDDPRVPGIWEKLGFLPRL